MARPLRRYEAVSRRSVLRRALGLGAGAVAVGACGVGDEEVFGAATATTATSATSTSTSTSPSSSVAATTTSSSAAQSGFATGGELVVAFTYTQLPGGKNLPPYMAVWVEDGAGELLRTIELWFEQSGKGPRWLPDLRRWFSVDQARIAGGGADTVDTISRATRLPGVTSVVWDGTVDDGRPGEAAAFVCIEAARERGPYSLIREPIAIDGAPFTLTLPDHQELTEAEVSYVV